MFGLSRGTPATEWDSQVHYNGPAVMIHIRYSDPISKEFNEQSGSSKLSHLDNNWL